MYRVIANNQLVSHMSGGSDVLLPFIQSNPVAPIVPSRLLAPLFVSRQSLLGQVEPNNTAIYEATVGGCDIWLDTYTDQRNIVLILDSKDIAQRYDGIMSSGIAPVYSDFTPHVVLQYDVMFRWTKYRWFYDDLLNNFNGKYRGSPLQFSGEKLDPTNQWYSGVDPQQSSSTPNSQARLRGEFVSLTAVNWDNSGVERP